MAGAVRTKEKCPRCGGKFEGKPLGCSSCLTVPRRYFVDLSWPGQGRIKLYSDQQGYPLDSWELASRLLTAIRYEIDQGKFDPRAYVKQELKTLRFENYAADWLERQAKRQERGDISRGYLAVARSIVNAYLIPHFGPRSIRDIREGQIEDFRERLPQNLKAKTVANILGILNKIFRDAYRRRDIGYLPEFPKIPLWQPLPSWIGEEDQEAMVAQVDNPIFKAFFLFLMKQGCRPGEARALRWDRVLFQEGVVIIAAAMDQEVYREHTKERDLRVLPLHDEVREALESLPRSLSGFVFTHRGKPLSKKMVSGAWRQAAMKAGIDIILGPDKGPVFVSVSCPWNFLKCLFESGRVNPSQPRHQGMK